MLKKKWIVIALLCLTLSLSFFAACQISFPYEPIDSVDSSYNGGTSGDITGGGSEETESSIKISNKPSVLNLGDEWQLAVTVNNIEGTVGWSSDNTSVITVTSGGKLTAKAVGKATITAAIGDYSDSVSVSVDDKVQPVLSANESGAVNVFVGGSYRANPTVSFNGSIVDDVDFSYAVDDSTVATVAEDGTVTTKKTGTCVITITAEYRAHTLTANYTVVSKEDKYISLDKNNISLYTYAISGEKTSERITAILTVNGAESDSEDVTWSSSDQTVATVENGMVTAVSEGNATITAKYTAEGSEVEAVCYVTVEKTATVIDTPFTIELDKALTLPTSTIADFAVANVISVKQGAVECLTTLEDGSKKLNKDLLVGSPDAKTLTVETNKVSYTVTATVYNAIIKTADDLDALQDKLSRLDRQGDSSSYGYYYDGYVLFGADIDYNGKTFGGICVSKHLKPSGSSAATTVTANGFAGIIDGGGHVISNIFVGDGFIGNLVKQDQKGTIKNLTFDGLTALNRSGGGIVQSIAEGTIENVTVKGKVQGYDSLGKYQAMGVVSAVINNANARFKNVTVFYDGVMNQPEGVAEANLCLVTVFGRMGGNYTNSALFDGCRVVGADSDGNSLPLFGYGLTEGTVVGYTPYTSAQGVASYSTIIAYLEATGWTKKSTKGATCTAAGYDVYEKDGEDDYTINYPALGHKWNKVDVCDVCEQAKSTSVDKEADVKNGFDFATLSTSKTISSVTYNGEALSGTSVTFENTDASMTAKVYEVNYTDGSVAVVNLTVWSLLMESEADMREMKNYVVKIPVNYQTGAVTTTSDYYQYVGYFKLTKDITWSNANWTQADGIVDNSTSWIKVFATQGFYGIIDGGNHTITGFRTVGNHSGLVNVLGTGGVIKNLTFNNVTIYGGTYYHGIIAGYAHGGTIENVTINGVDRSGSNAPSTVLVGTFCSPNAGQYYESSTSNYHYKAVITGVNIKNVEINAVNGTFGAEFGEDVSALGELETNLYTGTWADLALPKCENIVITGASTIIKQRASTNTYYSEWVGVNGKTENA